MGTNGGIGMVDIKDLGRMSDEGLDLIQKILLSETKEDVILEIERIKKERETKKGKTMNDLFLVDQLNIDREYIERLKSRGIFNMTQLLETDLDSISVEGSEARNQYEYACTMFDFRPQEELQKKLGRPLTQKEIAETVVAQVKVKRK